MIKSYSKIPKTSVDNFFLVSLSFGSLSVAFLVASADICISTAKSIGILNLNLKDKKVEFSLKVPFNNIVALYSKNENWQVRKESNLHLRFWRPQVYH